MSSADHTPTRGGDDAGLTLDVMAGQVRDTVSWLANNAKGISLVDWNERSNTLLAAADILARGDGVPGIYMASKAIHGPRWREVREAGWPIISTWIDESEAGKTTDWQNLWDRCANEPARAAVTVIYREAGEELKGALVEVGAALSHGRRVILVGTFDHTWAKHRNVYRAADLSEARELWMPWLTALRARLAASADAGTHGVRWRHVKRGSEYVEVGRASVQASTNDGFIEQGDTVVVYRGPDGRLWVREENEFEDGRFVRALASAEGADHGR